MVDFQFYQLSFLFVFGTVGIESTVCSTAVCALCRQCARTMGFFSTRCAQVSPFLQFVFGVAELQARVAAHWTWIVNASLDTLHADVDIFRDLPVCIITTYEFVGTDLPSDLRVNRYTSVTLSSSRWAFISSTVSEAIEPHVNTNFTLMFSGMDRKSDSMPIMNRFGDRIAPCGTPFCRV